jgi:hypothetical protein
MKTAISEGPYFVRAGACTNAVPRLPRLYGIGVTQMMWS